MPTTVGLYELCQHYIDHRLDVVVPTHRRSGSSKAQRRLHLVEGLLIALDAIDLVVSIIRSSQDVGRGARTGSWPSCRSPSPGRAHPRHAAPPPHRAREAEARGRGRGAAVDIDEYEQILGSEQRQRTIVLKELEELVEHFGRPRRTAVIGPDELDDVSLEAMLDDPDVTDEPCVVALIASGLIGREPVEGPKQASVRAPRRAAVAHADDRAHPGRRGHLARSRPGGSAASVAEVTGRSRGVAVSEVFTTHKGEEVLAIAGESDRAPATTC